VSLADLIPVRLPARKPRPQAKHRAADEVERLRMKLQWAHSLIRTQQVRIDDAEIRNDWTAAQQIAAEELVVQQQAAIDDLTAERDGLLEEVAALKRRFAAQLAADANATRITVPPMIRDTSALEDQATGPIDVRPLWAALGVQAVTDPGRIH
jgi:hypothetical protein